MREIQERREVDTNVDQMNFCWKTPGGYLFLFIPAGVKQIEVETENAVKGELQGIERNELKNKTEREQ